MHHIKPVELDKAYRLLNIGATTLVSARHEGVDDVMAAAWACALDLSPAKATVVIDKSHFTRDLIEQSNVFVLQLPTVEQAELVLRLGSVSRHDDPKKLEAADVKLFTMPGFENVPLVRDCSAWMIFKLIPEPHNEQAYDLFVGECVAAWADERVFSDGHWHFEKAPDGLRTLHYVAGGHFYAIGSAKDV